MSDAKTTNRRTKKTPQQLNYEIELHRHIRSGDRHPRLVILDDDGVVKGVPSKAQIGEFVECGTINGRHDFVIGVRFKDRRKKDDVSISLTRKEAEAFVRLL